MKNQDPSTPNPVTEERRAELRVTTTKLMSLAMLAAGPSHDGEGEIVIETAAEHLGALIRALHPGRQELILRRITQGMIAAGNEILKDPAVAEVVASGRGLGRGPAQQ